MANRLTNAIRLFIYYQAFGDYLGRNRSQTMERILALALLESLHKRLSYLRGDVILRLSDHIRRRGLSAPAVTNAARRQTIPAFRERGVWKIGESGDRHGQEQRVESRVVESFVHVAAGAPDCLRDWRDECPATAGRDPRGRWYAPGRSPVGAGLVQRRALFRGHLLDRRM